MDDILKNASLNGPDLHVGTEGELAGRRALGGDAFETGNGPFWHRTGDDGAGI